MAFSLTLRRMIGVALLAAATLTGGCKEDIVWGVTQAEALEIAVKLKFEQIEATTVPEPSDKERMFKIQVDSSEAFRAKEILLREQLPTTKPRGLAEIFANPSMIPTATEEKARLVIGLQGDLSASLEAVPNIVDAQVHIVLPEANPLESGRDRTEARAAVLIKYRGVDASPDDDAKRRDRWRRKEKLLLELRDDLIKLAEIWGRPRSRGGEPPANSLMGLVKPDDRDLKEIELFILKRSDEKDAKAATKSLSRLKRNHLARQGHLSALQNLPKVKDLDAVLDSLDAEELKVLPFRAASVRALVASSVPRLRENDIAVEFAEILGARKELTLTAGRSYSQLFLYAALGLAGVALLLFMGTLVWGLSLKKKLAAATAIEGDEDAV